MWASRWSRFNRSSLFKASVSINLVVRIGTGWLGGYQLFVLCRDQRAVHNSCEQSRSTGLDDAAEEGDPGGATGLAPFGLMAQSSGMEEACRRWSHSAWRIRVQELPPPADALQRADLTPQASQPIPRMTWNPIELPRQRAEICGSSSARNSRWPDRRCTEQIAHGVALLFLQSVGTANPVEDVTPDMPSDFDRFAEAMLLWCINSLLNRDQDRNEQGRGTQSADLRRGSAGNLSGALHDRSAERRHLRPPR